MSTINPTSPKAYSHADVAQAMDNIADALERVMAGIASLKNILLPEAETAMVDFDPKDPTNKFEVGGQMKLTPRGIEICYRLFDAGKSRYSVATLMGVSFGAATHRLDAWQKLGGVNRVKQPLE
jgi:hypothetical protein